MSATDEAPAHRNRLADETSPYLLQHAHNPVDWYPWGPEALEKARAEDKPILVSIGYSACHWCHVMERESFENEEIAAVMNREFVAIKVDREERPDVDHVYMTAVQILNQGGGGWPLNMFCTPEGKPFYGGTYFPPEDRHGMPGFKRLLEAIAQAYRDKREQVDHDAASLTGALSQMASMVAPSTGDIPSNLVRKAADSLEGHVDRTHGGLGSAPKFPNTFAFQLLLRAWHETGETRLRDAVTLTLDKMAAGGIYDHLGGAFARYSTDERWLVPHFEKMLYDNALLTELYVEGWQATGDPDYRRVAEETVDFVLAHMTGPGGGFFSTFDADSEGVEGKYYVWGRDEVEALLDAEEAKLFCRVYDVSHEGNWEGTNVLQRVLSDADAAKLFHTTAEDVAGRLERARATLLAARAGRVPPGRDEKVLTAWNGLMLSALARAGAAFGRADYLEAGRRNVELVWSKLRDERGRLLRSYKDGRARFDGYVDDYAFYGLGLLDLFAATYEPVFLERARVLADALLEHFEDPEHGGFLFTSHDHERLVTRTKATFDGAVPSGNSVAADLLRRLHVWTEEARYGEAAERTLRLMVSAMVQQPAGVARMVAVADAHTKGPTEVVLVGPRDGSATLDLLLHLRSRYLPRAEIYVWDPDGPETGEPPAAFARARPPVEGAAVAAYVCRGRACAPPVSTWEELEPLLA